jgi:hypothetical protein
VNNATKKESMMKNLNTVAVNKYLKNILNIEYYIENDELTTNDEIFLLGQTRTYLERANIYLFLDSVEKGNFDNKKQKDWKITNIRTIEITDGREGYPIIDHMRTTFQMNGRNHVLKTRPGTSIDELMNKWVEKLKENDV